MKYIIMKAMIEPVLQKISFFVETLVSTSLHGL